MSDLPATMTVIEIREPGAPEELTPATRALPTLTPRDILIKVAAAGVNRPDLSQRQGRYPPPPGASDIPGLEVAGTVVAMGPQATRFKIGDQVTALVHGEAEATKALEAAKADMVYASGRFTIAGTDRSIGLGDLAARQPDKRIFIENVNSVDGIAWPNRATIEIARSTQLFSRSAAITPSGNATDSASVSPTRPRAKVIGSRSKISFDTFSLKK